MALDVYAVGTALGTRLEGANTTTAGGLSAGLSRKVQLIKRGRWDKTPILNTQYPAVLYRITSRDQEWSELGPTARRRNTLSAEVVGIVFESPSTAAEQQMHLLADNIDTVLRGDLTLSNTVDWLLVERTEYDTDGQEDTETCWMVRMNLQLGRLA